MKLKDKVIIVTGASGGLGKVMAVSFGKEGANVILAARTEIDIKTVAGHIIEQGGSALAVVCEISREDDVVELIRRTIKKFKKIDTIVNNAGVGEKTIGSRCKKDLLDLKKNEWDIIMATNLTGPFLCTKYALPHMITRKKGNIINISSTTGYHAKRGMGAYSVSKHGLEGLTRNFANETVKYGINVNSLIPGGGVKGTGLHASASEEELSKMFPPEIITDAAVFLSSQKPFGVTGKFVNARDFSEQKFENDEEKYLWLKDLPPYIEERKRKSWGDLYS